jgi:hypothetical protein
MNDRAATTGPDRGWYEIRLQGRLASHWGARFDGFTLTPLEDGTTVLRGPLADQAALHGLLRRLADIGIPLLSLRRQDHDNDTTPDTPGD